MATRSCSWCAGFFACVTQALSCLHRSTWPTMLKKRRRRCEMLTPIHTSGYTPYTITIDESSCIVSEAQKQASSLSYDSSLGGDLSERRGCLLSCLSLTAIDRRRTVACSSSHIIGHCQQHERHNSNRKVLRFQWSSFPLYIFEFACVKLCCELEARHQTWCTTQMRHVECIRPSVITFIVTSSHNPVSHGAADYSPQI